MNEEIENSAVAQVDGEVTENVSAENRDKLTAQLDAYKRCFAALQTELAEIEQQFGAETKPADDPLKELTGEISAFKGELSELRRMLEELRNAPAPAVQSPVLPMLQQQPQQQPQQQYYYQSPMVTPAPLPYLQTPSFAPLMPTMPTFNR
jgi:septal ring factor EnvC (AmiA/AmiB activator)